MVSKWSETGRRETATRRTMCGSCEGGALRSAADTGVDFVSPRLLSCVVWKCFTTNSKKVIINFNRTVLRFVRLNILREDSPGGLDFLKMGLAELKLGSIILAMAQFPTKLRERTLRVITFFEYQISGVSPHGTLIWRKNSKDPVVFYYHRKSLGL